MTRFLSRPRLNIFKSHKNYSVQVIDDTAGTTLVTVTTMESDIKGKFPSRGNVSTAKAVGSLIAERSLAKGIKKVIFDRGGNRYHGAVKALADAAPMSDAKTMDEAVELSYKLAKKGWVVLLSPMCSSFDMYKNYKERGNAFREAVVKMRNSRHSIQT